MTRWYPDTCSCVIDYDDNINVTSVIVKCPKHSGTANDAHHLSIVLSHNRSKNAVLSAAIEVLGSVAAESISVEYDEADDLVISGVKLSIPQQELLKAKAAVDSIKIKVAG